MGAVTRTAPGSEKNPNKDHGGNKRISDKTRRYEKYIDEKRLLCHIWWYPSITRCASLGMKNKKNGSRFKRKTPRSKLEEEEI